MNIIILLIERERSVRLYRGERDTGEMREERDKDSTEENFN